MIYSAMRTFEKCYFTCNTHSLYQLLPCFIKKPAMDVKFVNDEQLLLF